MRMPAFAEKLLSPSGSRRSGENVQMALLICVFLGAGFCVVALVFQFLLLPTRKTGLDEQLRDYKALTAFVDPVIGKQNYALRDRYVSAQSMDNDNGLRSAVESQLGPLSDRYTSFPSTVKKPVGGGAKKAATGGTFEHTQVIDFKDAPLQELMDFVARVRQANQSVKVVEFTVNRQLRAGAASSDPSQDDRWTSKVTFVQYVTPSARPAKTAAPKAESDDDAGKPESSDAKSS